MSEAETQAHQFEKPTKTNLKFWGLEPELCTVSPDGRVNYNGTVRLFLNDMTHLPFPFGTISRYFVVESCSKLESLQGFPEEVRGSTELVSLPKLRSLEGIGGCRFNGPLDILDLPGLTSFHGMENCVVRRDLRLQDLPGVHDFRGLPVTVNRLSFVQWYTFTSFRGLPLMEEKRQHELSVFRLKRKGLELVAAALANRPEDLPRIILTGKNSFRQLMARELMSTGECWVGAKRWEVPH